MVEIGGGGPGYTAIPIIITTCRDGLVYISYRDNGNGTYSRVDVSIGGGAALLLEDEDGGAITTEHGVSLQTEAA